MFTDVEKTMLHIDQKVMDEALRVGMGKAPIVRLPSLAAEEIEWVETNIPIAGLREYLLHNAFAKHCQLCAQNLYSVKQMIKYNNNDYFPGVTEEYLIIGSAPNGDSIAINKDGYNAIGFIGHETPKE